MGFAHTLNLFLRPHQQVIRPVLNSYLLPIKQMISPVSGMCILCLKLWLIYQMVSCKIQNKCSQYIHDGMLFQKQRGSNDQNTQDQGSPDNDRMLPERFTFCHGCMDGNGIKHMNARKYIGRGIGKIQYHICEDVVPGKCCRP